MAFVALSSVILDGIMFSSKIGGALIPISTRIEDMEAMLAFLSRQVGWVSVDKAKKSLDAKLLDDRKVGAIAYLKLIDRDGTNLKATPRGMRFQNGDRVKALREGILDSDLYRHTVEWLHFGARAEVTAVEVGQYWQAQHRESVGEVTGDRLKDGAVFFFRVAEGANLGSLIIGRGGKETRFTTSPDQVSALLDTPDTDEDSEEGPSDDTVAPAPGNGSPSPASGAAAPYSTAPTTPSVQVSASPNVHVNVEIHIAANATADTVKEIFRNMARYVLDKHVDD
ncbi:hypothetical protein [Arthrobacter citreus]|uniref:hypothetical protein n=1 Tax=Arthrobacter citreus TaxID=1670 RepID=UPI0036DE37C3